jgi:hypothetical protein
MVRVLISPFLTKVGEWLYPDPSMICDAVIIACQGTCGSDARRFGKGVGALSNCAQGGGHLNTLFSKNILQLMEKHIAFTTVIAISFR